jgi:hypothetical protein
MAAYANFTCNVQRSEKRITRQHADCVIGILQRLYNLKTVSYNKKIRMMETAYRATISSRLAGKRYEASKRKARLNPFA